MRPIFQRVCSLVLPLVLVAFSGCASRNIVQAPTGRFELKQGGFNQYTPEQDIEIGRQATAEVNRSLPVLPESSPIVKYIQQLGQSLAAQTPGPKWPFNFHVVNQKEINAFALPGGPIYVNLGTITAADDEGQLAGVLAHEISHIVLRHSTEQASKAMLAQVPLAVLGGVLPQGVGGQLARLGLSFGAQSVFLKYSRDAEREADLLGSQIMYDVGFSPYSMVEFFTKLEQEGGAGAPEFLSDHPNPGNRAELVKQAVSKFPKKSYRKNSAEFERVKADAAKMKPLSALQIAERQRQQTSQPMPVSVQDVLPSGQFQQLDHSFFQIAYPSNWEAFGNANSAVVLAPRAGVGQNAIAYGVLISGLRPQPGRDSLVDGTGDLVRMLQQGNPEIRVAANPEPVSVNGVPGLAVNLVGPSPIEGSTGPLPERDLLVTVQRPDRSLLFLLFIAPQRDFDQLSPAFQQMLSSLRIRS